jgi:hypothetical protein
VDPDKVKAIVEMERPDNISGIRRFLGMVNQLNKFSPKITELTKPLRELLKVDTRGFGTRPKEMHSSR